MSKSSSQNIKKLVPVYFLEKPIYPFAKPIMSIGVFS